MVLSWLATTEFGRYDVLAGSAQYRRKRPLVSVDVGEVHEWRGLALVQLPRVRHPLRGATAGAGARAVVLAEEHGLLPGGVVPVVPSRGRDDGGEVRPGEDDGSVGAPRPTQPHLPRAHDVAVHERQARPLGERRTPVRRDAPRDGAVRGGVGDGADGAAEVEGARVAEDKVDGALDVAAAEEVAALLVQQRVLGAVEAAPVEGGLVAPDAQRHRLAARVPRVGGASRVLDADVVGHEVGGEDGDGGAVEGAAGGVCWNRTAHTRRVRRGRPHTRRAHPGCRAATHAHARIAAGFRSLGPTLPQKASLLGGCTLNLINHATTPSPHNVGLFPIISPSHIVSRDLSENALGQTGSDTNCWNRTAHTRRVRRGRPHTRRAHPGCRAATHAPARIAAGFRSLGPTLPPKS
jgi:hypothetical protein